MAARSASAAFDTFRQLVDLSYGPSFIRPTVNAQPPSSDTILNLLTVADLFNFTNCVDECASELRRSISSKGCTTVDLLRIINSILLLPAQRDSVNELLYDALDEIKIPLWYWWKHPDAVSNMSIDEALVDFFRPYLEVVTCVDTLAHVFEKHPLLYGNYGENKFTLLHLWLESQNLPVHEKQELFKKVLSVEEEHLVSGRGGMGAASTITRILDLSYLSYNYFSSYVARSGCPFDNKQTPPRPDDEPSLVIHKYSIVIPEAKIMALQNGE